MIDLKVLSDLELLALTIIGESRGEPIEGQVAVGSVILNRAKKYKDSIQNVVLRPKQFSCWNLDDPNRAFLEELGDKLLLGNKIDIRYKQCMFVARGLLQDEVNDNTRGALHYLTSDLFYSPKRPKWAEHFIGTSTKGNQIFFNIVGEK